MTIIHHPDVRRMLLSMKAQNEAMRALAYTVAAQIDIAAIILIQQCANVIRHG